MIISRLKPKYLVMDRFSHWGGVRFFLRPAGLIVLLGTARDGCLVVRFRCPEAAAILGAIVAL